MTKAETNRMLEIQRQIFLILASVGVLLVLLYIYLTAASIVDVANRKRIEGEIIGRRNEAIALELSYIEKQNSLTPELAREMGFTEPHTQFASRSSSVAKLSLVNEN